VLEIATPRSKSSLIRLAWPTESQDFQDRQRRATTRKLTRPNRGRNHYQEQQNRYGSSAKENPPIDEKQTRQGTTANDAREARAVHSSRLATVPCHCPFPESPVIQEPACSGQPSQVSTIRTTMAIGTPASQPVFESGNMIGSTGAGNLPDETAGRQGRGQRL
jgi:hypothetical protein